MLLNVISCSPGSLVGSVADGHCSHHAHGWLHKDLQRAHTEQQPQAAATQAAARYSAPCLCFCVLCLFSVRFYCGGGKKNVY